jgi:hypothetical protein
MISDIVSEAQAQIVQYIVDQPTVYAPFRDKILSALGALRALEIALAQAPNASHGFSADSGPNLCAGDVLYAAMRGTSHHHDAAVHAHLLELLLRYKNRDSLDSGLRSPRALRGWPHHGRERMSDIKKILLGTVILFAIVIGAVAWGPYV